MADNYDLIYNSFKNNKRQGILSGLLQSYLFSKLGNALMSNEAKKQSKKEEEASQEAYQSNNTTGINVPAQTEGLISSTINTNFNPATKQFEFADANPLGGISKKYQSLPFKEGVDQFAETTENATGKSGNKFGRFQNLFGIAKDLGEGNVGEALANGSVLAGANPIVPFVYGLAKVRDDGIDLENFNEEQMKKLQSQGKFDFSSLPNNQPSFQQGNQASTDISNNGTENTYNGLSSVALENMRKKLPNERNLSETSKFIEQGLTNMKEEEKQDNILNALVNQKDSGVFADKFNTIQEALARGDETSVAGVSDNPNAQQVEVNATEQVQQPAQENQTEQVQQPVQTDQVKQATEAVPQQQSPSLIQQGLLQKIGSNQIGMRERYNNVRNSLMSKGILPERAEKSALNIIGQELDDRRTRYVNAISEALDGGQYELANALTYRMTNDLAGLDPVATQVANGIMSSSPNFKNIYDNDQWKVRASITNENDLKKLRQVGENAIATQSVKGEYNLAKARIDADAKKYQADKKYQAVVVTTNGKIAIAQINHDGSGGYVGGKYKGNSTATKKINDTFRAKQQRVEMTQQQQYLLEQKIKGLDPDLNYKEYKSLKEELEKTRKKTRQYKQDVQLYITSKESQLRKEDLFQMRCYDEIKALDKMLNNGSANMSGVYPHLKRMQDLGYGDFANNYVKTFSDNGIFDTGTGDFKTRGY